MLTNAVKRLVSTTMVNKVTKFRDIPEDAIAGKEAADIITGILSQIRGSFARQVAKALCRTLLNKNCAPSHTIFVRSPATENPSNAIVEIRRALAETGIDLCEIKKDVTTFYYLCRGSKPSPKPEMGTNEYNCLLMEEAARGPNAWIMSRRAPNAPDEKVREVRILPPDSILVTLSPNITNGQRVSRRLSFVIEFDEGGTPPKVTATNSRVKKMGGDGGVFDGLPPVGTGKKNRGNEKWRMFIKR